MPRALISVSDKTGIVELARELDAMGWHLVSTGGTARTLREAGLMVMDVAQLTGHPEMLDGRVKTLHPAVHAGLLGRRTPQDIAEMNPLGYAPIDLVVVNLYPFAATIARPGVTFDEAIENIDIGGPSMLRSAAKNHPNVYVVVDPGDYERVLMSIRSREPAGQLRRELALKVFEHTAAYDALIARWLAHQVDVRQDERFPPTLVVPLYRAATLRYGENPDQEAAFYQTPGRNCGIAGLEQLHGKELSYNNLLDLDGAFLAISPFARSLKPAVAILKHTIPCGLAIGLTVLEAFERARATDPVSAFGSVVVSSMPIDREAAEAMAELFIECLVAPDFDADALEVLTQKKSIRVLRFEGGLRGKDASDAWLEAAGGITVRAVAGGVLAQTLPVPPLVDLWPAAWKVVTERDPTANERFDMLFAWGAIFAVKSNAILLARDGMTLGIGAGQTSRVDSSRIAVSKAHEHGHDTFKAVMASDAFFPFRDGVDAAAEAGVQAIVQPGGSVRDPEVIHAANEHNIAMVFTGRRLFRH